MERIVVVNQQCEWTQNARFLCICMSACVCVYLLVSLSVNNATDLIFTIQPTGRRNIFDKWNKGKSNGLDKNISKPHNNVYWQKLSKHIPWSEWYQQHLTELFVLLIETFVIHSIPKMKALEDLINISNTRVELYLEENQVLVLYIPYKRGKCTRFFVTYVSFVIIYSDLQSSLLIIYNDLQNIVVMQTNVW